MSCVTVGFVRATQSSSLLKSVQRERAIADFGDMHTRDLWLGVRPREANVMC